MNTKLLSHGLCVFALSSCTLFSQQTNNIPKTLHTTQKSQIHIPSEEPSGLVKIFGNLGSRTDTYNPGDANTLSGPNSVFEMQNFQGLPFTPLKSAKVTVVEAAIGYDNGDNQINLSLYTDASGAPGTLIAGPFTIANLPFFGNCCQLAIWKLTSALSVTAGNRYWIVADTPPSGPGSNFLGTWNYIFPTPFQQAYNIGYAWQPFSGGEQQMAAAVLGELD